MGSPRSNGSRTVGLPAPPISPRTPARFRTIPVRPRFLYRESPSSTPRRSINKGAEADPMMQPCLGAGRSSAPGCDLYFERQRTRRPVTCEDSSRRWRMRSGVRPQRTSAPGKPGGHAAVRRASTVVRRGPLRLTQEVPGTPGQPTSSRCRSRSSSPARRATGEAATTAVSSSTARGRDRLDGLPSAPVLSINRDFLRAGDRRDRPRAADLAFLSAATTIPSPATRRCSS
jgi:hypothetical protein